MALIATLIVVDSALHFGTSTEYRYLHEIYQRVYYIPILLAAFWFGPFIGFCTSLAVSLIYSIHIQLHWHHFPTYTFNQYAEICLYHVIALVIGFLSLKERRQREKVELTSQQLSYAYDKLQETFEQLRRADRLAALGELSAGIAHEIRNPLGSIKGSIDIIEGEFTPQNPKREFIEIIKEETARLNNIVSGFLKFARPPSPAIKLTSINRLIESILTLLQNEAEQSGIEIRRQLDPDLPEIEIDPDQIRQVLLNVTLNALQAMPQGGQLEIETVSSNEILTIAIRDSGDGIPEEKLEQAFDPFYSTKPNGSGLGLSISHQLIENHGGSIHLSNRVSGGLTVRIELPLKSESSSKNGAKPTQRPKLAPRR